MKIEKHKLVGENISFKQTPNTSGKFGKSLPDMIIIHYTAAPSASSAVNWLTNKTAKASAHLVVSRDGKITQLADFDTITWHAGVSKWEKRNGINNFSIGIEIDNCGILKKQDAKTYIGTGNTKFSSDEVVLAVHRNGGKQEAWHKYPDSQIELVFAICKLLCETYNIQYILGHEEIAPGRKTDPGPAFPLDRLRTELLGGDKVATPKAPAIPAQALPEKGVIIKDSPLFEQADSKSKQVMKKINSNTEVRVLEQKNDFYKIAVFVNGYVSKNHVVLDNTDSSNDGSTKTDGLNFRSKADAKSDPLGLPLPKDTKFHLLP